MMSSEDEFYEVEKIIASKFDEDSCRYRYRIRWKGFGPEHDTWEPKENLNLCLDLLKTFREEKKRRKQIKKQISLTVPPISIKSEPTSDNEKIGEDEREEEDDDSDDENGDVIDNDSNDEDSDQGSFLYGFTRRQKQQYLDMLKQSKEDLLPAKIDASSHSDSEVSEVITTKRKKKKLDFSDSETDDDMKIDVDKKKMPSEILDSVLHPEKMINSVEKQLQRDDTMPDVDVSVLPQTPLNESKSSKVLKSMSYISLVDQLQEKTENIILSPDVPKKSNLKKVPGNIQYEDKIGETSQTLNLSIGNGKNSPTQFTCDFLGRPSNKRFDNIKSKLLNLQNLTNKPLLVSTPHTTPSTILKSPSKSTPPISKIPSVAYDNETNKGKMGQRNMAEKECPIDDLLLHTKINKAVNESHESPLLSKNKDEGIKEQGSTIPCSNVIQDILNDIELGGRRSTKMTKPNDANAVKTLSSSVCVSSSSSVSFSSKTTQPQPTSTSTTSNVNTSSKTIVSNTPRKVPKRTILLSSSPAVTEGNASNKKDKSRRLSLKEYQAKKHRKGSTDDAPLGMELFEFTPVPNSQSLSKASGPIRTNNSLDNSAIIPPKSIEKQKRPSIQNTQNASSSNRVPHEQLATNTDVLGNILLSINPYNSRVAGGQQKENGRNTSGILDDEPPLSTSCQREDIILEEGDQSSDRNNDFETDLEECSSDEEFFGEPTPRTNHSQRPGANSIQMEHIFVNQCICKGDIETLIKCQIRENKINEYVDGEDTLLMKAVMECAPPMVQIMLEKGANPNERSKNGKTPLMIAVELRQKKLVRMLIQFGAHLNVKTSDGKSALDMACSSGSIEIVHLLLLYGADVKPTMESLNKPTSKNIQVPQHTLPMLTSAINKHFEKLSEIVYRTLTDVTKSNSIQLDKCLMPVRCLSPSEQFHTLYFDECGINVTEKHQNVIFVAIPVVFERQGRIRVIYDLKNNGIQNVILNPGPKEEKDLNIEAVEGSNFIHILFPKVGYNVLSISTYEKSSYKILVSVYSLSFGRQTVIPHHRSLSDSGAQAANTALSIR